MRLPTLPSGVTAETLLDKLESIIRRRIDAIASIRVNLGATDGAGNWTIQRLTEDNPTAEYYTTLRHGTYAIGDEVACVIIGGKPVIIGKIRRTAVRETADFGTLTAQKLTLDGTGLWVSDIQNSGNQIWIWDQTRFEAIAQFDFNTINNATHTFTTIDVDNLHILDHIATDSNPPTVAMGSGAGTGATWTISGNDSWGWIEVVTGTSPSSTADAVVFSITLRNPWTNTNYATFIHPRNQRTGLEVTKVYARPSTSSVWFACISGNGALLASTTYRWSYFVGGVV